MHGGRVQFEQQLLAVTRIITYIRIGSVPILGPLTHLPQLALDIAHSALGEVFVSDNLNGAVLQRMSPQGTLTAMPLNPPLGAIDSVVHDDVKQLIYVTDRSDMTVHAVDPATGSTTLVVDGFSSLGVAGLEIDSIGRRLWVTDASDNRVYEFALPSATDPATYTTFGQGCPGSVGVPILTPALGQLPWTGSPFTVELTNLPATFLAIMVTGLSNTTLGGVPLPLSLAAAGMPNCDLYISSDFLFTVGIVDGRASWTLAVPATVSLAGFHFYNQGAVLDPGVNSLGLVLSNAGAGTIGVR